MARKKNIFLGLIDLIVTVLTVAALLSLVAAYLAPSVDPNKGVIFAYFGLAAPVIYLVNVFLMLYWALRWKAIFFVCALAVVCGAGQISKFYRITGSVPTEEPGENEIKVLTFNVEGFMDIDHERNVALPTVEQVTEFLRRTEADIICLQEYQSTFLFPQEKIDSLLSDWPYRAIHYTVARPERGIWGTAIYSKYPICDYEEIRFDSTVNGALRADVLFGEDTLRVFCNHLQTTYVDKKNLEFLNYYNFTQEPDKKGHLKLIGGRLRRGFRKRAVQADSIAVQIARSPYPTIVCGDFNDTPASYSYTKIRGDLLDAFQQSGEGYGYTYKRLRKMMRIDYVLFSEEFESISYDSPDFDCSDHHPVIAVLRLKKEVEGTE